MSTEFQKELRFFLEGVCCDLVRFRHVHEDDVAPADVRIEQEVPIGEPGSYADIRVHAPKSEPYFVEVKYGYPTEMVGRHLRRKYGQSNGSKIILVIDTTGRNDGELRRAIDGLNVEIWDEKRLFSLLDTIFGVEVHGFTEADVVDIQLAIDRARGGYVFGEKFANDPLQSSLLWHFGFWHLRKLMAERPTARALVPPGLYRDVVVIFADLTSFSSFVRDTRDDRVVRNVLTAFYAKSRYQVINNHGMMYQFLGDGVLALFGIPDRSETSATDALDCARALVNIGASVTADWQRQIDHVQTAGGTHVGIAAGDVNIVSLRPFGRAHIGAIGDSINTAARLSSAAGNNEIVITNSFYQRLPESARGGLEEMSPVEAKNIGKIRAWRGR